MIRIECDKCGLELRVQDDYAGKPVRCKGCGQVNIAGVAASTETTLEAAIPDFEQWDADLFAALLQYEQQAPPIEMP